MFSKGDQIMKTKLLLALPLAALVLTGCGNRQSAEKTDFKIGICQLGTHPALDKATEGFMAAVKEGLGEEHVEFDLQDAAFDSGTCITINNSFVSKKVDLIMANATPALQAAYNSTTTIPILGTSVTEYGIALDLKNFDQTKGTGENVSGTSDLAPLAEQAQMIKDVFPSAATVGLLYCSAEPNSLYQVGVMETELAARGVATTRISFSDSNDLSTVLSGLIDPVDVIYVPTDNTCASSAETIHSICSSHNKPVVAGEEGICAKAGAVTLSISYEVIGRKTGQMAVDILKNKADIGKMAIQYDTNPVKKYNPTICTELGLTPPEGYVAIEA